MLFGSIIEQPAFDNFIGRLRSNIYKEIPYCKVEVRTEFDISLCQRIIIADLHMYWKGATMVHHSEEYHLPIGDQDLGKIADIMAKELVDYVNAAFKIGEQNG